MLYHRYYYLYYYTILCYYYITYIFISYHIIVSITDMLRDSAIVRWKIATEATAADGKSPSISELPLKK